MTVKWYVQCSRGCLDVLKTFISTKRKSVKENINKLLRLYKNFIHRRDTGSGVQSPTMSHQRRKNGTFALLSLLLGIIRY